MATLNYIELPATDVARAKAFYSTVFGWEWIDYGPGYAASTSPAVEVALNGHATVGPGHEPGAQNAVGPLILFETDDLETTEQAIRSAGGDIASSAYPYPGGSRLHFVDPSGNILGVYQPGQT